MKSEASIRRKLQQVLYRHLKRELETNLQQLPQTCGFNGKVKGINMPHICLYGAGLPGSWQGKVCDANIPGGVAQAKACPFWKPKQTKEEIKAAFKKEVARNRAGVAQRFPDAAALLWVLEEEGVLDFDSDGEGTPPSRPEEDLEETSAGVLGDESVETSEEEAEDDAE